MRLAAWVIFVFTLSVATISFAQQGGAVPIRIPNAPASSCIDSGTDKVWLTLLRVVTTKKNGWFTSDNQTEAIINVTVRSDPRSDKALTFPLSTKLNVKDYAAGQISVPVEYTLVDGLVLKQGTTDKSVTYTGFGVELHW